MSTNCLDLMDLLNINQMETNDYLLLSQKKHQRNPSHLNKSFAPSNKTISTRQYSQLSQRKQTIETGYRSIAYSSQIQRVQQSKQNHRSISLVPNMNQMHLSFEKMEFKMNKFQLSQPEAIEQKYMITGFLQMSKDYQAIIQIINNQMYDLNTTLLQQSSHKKDDLEFQIDSYFQKNFDLLSAKVLEFYKIKECFYRFIRMGIQEPYHQRVLKKIEILEKQNFLFEYFQIYLELFKFMKLNSFDCFKNDIIIIHSLQQSPIELNFGELFFEKMQEFKQKILLISQTQESQILNRIFQNKIEQIQNWISLIKKMANFKYAYYIKYLLVSQSRLKKIIKSKKLYDQIIQLMKEAEQFQVCSLTLNIFYKDEIEKFIFEFNQMKLQIIEWNIHLQEDELCQQVLILIKQNIKLKRMNKNLEIFNSLKEGENLEKKQQFQGQELICKLKLSLQLNSHIINQIKESSEIKSDEYIKYQYNKFIILKDYFLNLYYDAQ
ncbi:unnamed protein product [Paramecium sonneborni]|uniref:Uncharacterized protein n=1 Tax=Paramecium sonneborni TaxID=65129 RepID=A0A8S1P779_9CILI|nr:unnamed protein product [Paramecium sonneborni]